MVGVPGAGKSFFAEHFSDTFSAPLVSWNVIRDELFNEPTFSKDEDVIVERIAQRMLAELMKTRATVLLETSVLTQTARQALAKTIHAAGYEPLFVWVQTDTATAKTRALKKGVPAAVVLAAEKKFTPFKESDPFIVISGKHTYASQLKIVLRRLSGAREMASAANASVRTGAPVKIASQRRVRIQ
jgi:predicted kinase